MTKKKITFALVGLMLFGLLFAQGATPLKKTTVPADPNKDPKLVDRPVPIGVPEHAIDALNLSQAQKDAFGTLRTNHQKQMIDLKASADKIELDIKEALKNQNFSEAKRLNTTLYSKKKEMADARIDLMQAMQNQLTSEQKLMVKSSPEIFNWSRWGNRGMWGMGSGMDQLKSRNSHHMGGRGGMRQRIRNPEHCGENDENKPVPPSKPNTKTTDTPKKK